MIGHKHKQEVPVAQNTKAGLKPADNASSRAQQMKFRPSMLPEAQMRARSLWDNARGGVAPQTTLAAEWATFIAATGQCAGRLRDQTLNATAVEAIRAEQLHLADAAVELFGAFASLGYDDRAALTDPATREVPNTPAALAVADRFPVLARWMVARDAGRAEQDRLQAITRAERDRAVALAEPARLLAAFRAAGLVLQVRADGDLELPGGSDLGRIDPHDLALLKDYKPAVAALIRAENAAAAPFKVA